MKFLRNLLAAIVGCLIAFGIIFMMFFVFAALVGNADNEINVKSNSVLELGFSKPIVDYSGSTEDDPFGGFFQESQSLDEIIHAIKVATNDNKIKGISLQTSFFLGGLAQAQEVRQALEDFKANDKFIYAFADYYTQKDYYMASVADKIFLNPVGGMEFRGLSSEVLYFKDLQEKTGVKMEVVRHGKYKSAVEPFLMDTMSAENYDQIKTLITSIWDAMLEDVSESRNITRANLNTIADTLGARLPKYAVKAGLIDKVMYADEYEGVLKEILNVDDDDRPNYVPFDAYKKLAKRKRINKGNDGIAVIYAQGEIYYGEGSKDVIGQGIITRALRKARNNDKIRAIVLRINSPGGSALTSDIIWREVELTKKEKPVVVSFGDVAASGGYYIGVAGDKIFAEPTTITGSIGVFGVVPNVNELAADIGVNAEQVGTNKNSVQYSVFEPMTSTFRSTVKEGIEKTYEEFLSRVAQGRNISMKKADELAQGRVWSGIDAKKIGLVDEIGSLDDAIAEAAKMVESESYRVYKYPRYKSGFDQLMEDLGNSKVKIGEAYLKSEIGEENYEMLQQFKNLTKQEGIQAKLPFHLSIK